jgi:hypothetical protein
VTKHHKKFPNFNDLENLQPIDELGKQYDQWNLELNEHYDLR